MKPKSDQAMKNYRIFNGITQYVAADNCEQTSQQIVFFEAERIVKSYPLSEVRRVEELDDKMMSRKVIYQEGSELPG
jgi:hypothetical protein